MATNIPVLEEIREDKITTVVADDLEIKGTIKFKTSVMLKGVFEGEIFSDGLLVVGPTAKVTATITTKTLVSDGVITGNVTANEQIVLNGTSTHTGDLKTSFLTIENGALFNGKAVMERFEEKETQEEGISAEPYESIAENTIASEQPPYEAIEGKHAPFAITRQDQKKKYGKDKMPTGEFGKSEESLNAAEQTDPEDKPLF
jgi:cytoskeletal protein CcmA (bactofilin family)